jgi:FtsH-binding integral membrane protein
MKLLKKFFKSVLWLILAFTYGSSPLWAIVTFVILIGSFFISPDNVKFNLPLAQSILAIFFLLSILATEHNYGGFPEGTTPAPPPETRH